MTHSNIFSGWTVGRMATSVAPRPHRVEGDGPSSFPLLASERSENAEEASYAFTCAIRLV